MELIILTGKVYGEVEPLNDDNNRKSVLFRIYCSRVDFTKTDKGIIKKSLIYQIYHITTPLVSSCRDLKEGDSVFVLGYFKTENVRDENGKINLAYKVWAFLVVKLARTVLAEDDI